MKVEFDLRETRTWALLAVAFIVIAFAGSIAIVKIGVSLDAGWISDLVKGPKLQKIELGNCTQLFDRDTGQITKESCRPPEEEVKLQTLTENLRKLTAELSQTKADLEQSRAQTAQQKAVADDALSKLRKQEEKNADLVQQRLSRVERRIHPDSAQKISECLDARGAGTLLCWQDCDLSQILSNTVNMCAVDVPHGQVACRPLFEHDLDACRAQ